MATIEKRDDVNPQALPRLAGEFFAILGVAAIDQNTLNGTKGAGRFEHREGGGHQGSDPGDLDRSWLRPGGGLGGHAGKCTCAARIRQND